MKHTQWYAVAGVCAWLLPATALHAQETLSADFEITETILTLPRADAQAAGYPRWREVVMNGPRAVPYAYCQWLFEQSPWLLDSFGASRFDALKNCADGISSVTQEVADEAAPTQAMTGTFWNTRPVGYRYLVPDTTVTEAEFFQLFAELEEEFVFVPDPAVLAGQLSDLSNRLEQVESWQETAGDPNLLLTQESLANEGFLTEREADSRYVQTSDLPDVELYTQTEADERFATPEDLAALRSDLQSEFANQLEGLDLPEGDLLTTAEANDSYLRRDTIPDGDSLLTVDTASGLFAAAGSVPAEAFGPPAPTTITKMIGLPWYWILATVAALLLAIVACAWGAYLGWKVLSKKHGLAVVERKANQALQQSRTAIDQNWPEGWELVGKLPEQHQLDELQDEEKIIASFKHDTGESQDVEFVLCDTAFPQNEGLKQRGLVVRAEGTSNKAAACRVGRVINECRKALEERGLAPIQPRAGDGSGEFVAVPK